MDNNPGTRAQAKTKLLDFIQWCEANPNSIYNEEHKRLYAKARIVTGE